MSCSYIRTMQQPDSHVGRLRISVESEGRDLPVPDATVDVSYTGEPDRIIEQLSTDSSGKTEEIELSAPPQEYSLSPGEEQPYSEYTVRVSAEGYETITVSGSEVMAGQISVQDVRMRPVREQEPPDVVVIGAHTLYGNYPPKIAEAEIKPVNQSGEIVLSRVVVPEFVVVHDGAPRDTTATDYYVRYKDYIKNVASSEIYSTWPRETIVANVLAIMSFTLNRVYTEWYRNHCSFVGAYLGAVEHRSDEGVELFHEHQVFEKMLLQHEYLHQVSLEEVFEFVEKVITDASKELIV